MDAESEVADTETETTGEVENTGEVEETVTDTETEDKPEYTEHEKKMFERAKKAEAEVKALKEKLKPLQTAKPDSQSNLSQKDLVAIIRANVADDDIDEVKDYATLKKISVADALKAQFIKTLLKEKEEERQSAAVANTGGARRTTTKVSVDQQVSNLENKGELPESDDDLKAMILARQKARNR